MDKKYARILADFIPAEHRYVVDNFCDRSLPSDQYGKNNKNETVIHFSDINEKWLKNAQKEENSLLLVYGSFYLVGEIMRLSRYKPFATA